MGCQKSLYSGLDEVEVNKMISALQRHGISSTKEVSNKGETYSISVSKDDFENAIEILESYALPNKRFDTTKTVFSGGGLVTSPLEERARFTYAKSQELAMTISRLDGVLSARVHISDLLDDTSIKKSGSNQNPRTASVVIRRHELAHIKHFIPNIKKMISSSLDNVFYEDVAVIDFIVPKPSFEKLTQANTKTNAASLIGGVASLVLIVFAIPVAFFIFKSLSRSNFTNFFTHFNARKSNISDSDQPIKDSTDVLLPKLSSRF